MDLEPCTAREFDVEVIRYASMNGWRYKIVSGQRCEGYLGERMVLLIQRRGLYAEHFAEPVPIGPIPVLPEGGYR